MKKFALALFLTAALSVAHGQVNNPTSGGGGSGTVTSVTGTANQIDVATGTTTPVISLDPSLILPAGTTGLPVATGISGLGTGVATALAVNVGSAGAPVINGGAGGTPSGLVITNATGTCAACVANSATLSAPLASPTFTGTVTDPLLVVNGAGAASVSPLLLSGAFVSGGTGTTSFPQLYIFQSGQTAVNTWSTVGTALGINANIGNLIDAHAGGPSLFSVNGSGAVTSAGIVQGTQLRSSIATGTAPMTATSTTPVTTMVVANHPQIDNCGTTTTCAATAQTGGRIQFGTVALTAGSATVGSLIAFTSTTSFRCTASDNTTGTLGANAVPASTTSITVTGTTTDTISYICVGN